MRGLTRSERPRSKKLVRIGTLNETRWKGAKAREIGEDAKLFYNGKDTEQYGVAIAMAESLKDSVSAVNRISSRIMAVTIDTKEGANEKMDLRVPKWAILPRTRRAITDVGVASSFNTGSDHRLLRALLAFERSHVRLSRIQSRQPRATVLDTNTLKTLIENVPLDMKEDINERRQMDRKNNHVEYTLLNRFRRQRVAEDLKNFSRYFLLEAASNRRSVKKTKRELAQYRLTIFCLKGPDGFRTTSRPEIGAILTNFYLTLLKADHGISTERIPIGEKVPSFLPSVVHHPIETMPKGKPPGADGLSLEALQACSHEIHCASAQRFTLRVNDCKAPDAWRKSKTVLLFKKGDKEDLGNYRPITLLPVIYKGFTRCLLARIRRKLDEAQPVEQAGFRRKFSTLDHIITCC
ncbi:hypothetical protein V3C99_017946 [Haemonchus contortus]|uniref:Reverse transcriptase domain-containing protein n=1 Tax=Haemonchus contortus TaxID=6289 RepID=A0A7I4Z352_HAECO